MEKPKLLVQKTRGMACKADLAWFGSYSLKSLSNYSGEDNSGLKSDNESAHPKTKIKALNISLISFASKFLILLRLHYFDQSNKGFYFNENEWEDERRSKKIKKEKKTNK